jgi:hypothetical protein
MLFSRFDVGCDLLRIASLALAAHGFEALGQTFVRLGMVLLDGNTPNIRALN